MKNMKLFISLVLVVILCVVLAGCADRPSNGNEGWKDPNEPNNAEWTDPNNPDDTDWRDPNQPDNDADWRDPNNPADNPTDPSQTGNYRHEIDGIVFYTDHDINQWIDGNIFHAYDMVDAIYGGVIKTDGEGGVRFTYSGVITSVGFSVTEGYKPNDTAYPYFYIFKYHVYEHGNYGQFYFIDDSYCQIPYELLELSLYTLEQWDKGNDTPLEDLGIASSHFELFF